MDSLFIEYRDPMFGLIVLFGVIFIISFVNYWWGAYKSKEERQGIEQFVKRFEIVSDEDEYKDLLKDHAIPVQALALLAHGYVKSGDFEKAIGIYLLALERTKKRDQKQYILSELGKTYFKAGFLRRSSDVFLESLKMYPRNEESLKYLGVTYEKLKEYSKAIEVMDALEELGAKVADQRDYLRALDTLYDYKFTDEQKLKKLFELKKDSPFVERKIFEFWQNSAAQVPMSEFESFDHKRLLDLLWYCDPNWLDISTCKAPILKEISNAKGLSTHDLDTYEYFELEVLYRLRKSGFTKAILNFEFMCNSCKNAFPVYFSRCPNCQSIDSAVVQAQISKESYEENLSFQ